MKWLQVTNRVILEKVFIVIVVICVILLFPSKRLGSNSRVDKKSNCQINENGDNTFTSSGVLVMMMMNMIGIIIMVKIAILVRKTMVKMMMMRMMIYHQGEGP